jgi:hypothetical protein
MADDIETTRRVSLQLPSGRVLKLAAVGFFTLDFLGALLGGASGLHLVSLWLALYVLDELL